MEQSTHGPNGCMQVIIHLFKQKYAADNISVVAEIVLKIDMEIFLGVFTDYL